MKTDNELIADFMGGVFYGPDDLDHPNKWWFPNQPHEGYRKDAHHLTSGLRYPIDWSWLMPVVEKIEEEVSKPGQSGVVGWYFWNDTFDGQVFTDIQKTYQFVVEFIKWHNNVSPDKKQ